MALDITSATTSSSTSSFGCIDNFPKPPSSVHTRPSKSSISNSTNNLLPPLNSYPPMPCSEIDLKYIPIDPLYLPQHRPSPPFRLGEDISRTGAGTRYIRITARDPTLAYISLCQDGTLSHYSQPFSPVDIINPETCNVLKRCTRVGRAAWLLLKEIVLLFKACTCQGSSPSSSGRPHLRPTGPPTSSGPSGRTHRTLPASVLFSSCTLVCSLSITGRPSTCYLHPPSVYVSIPGP